MSKKKIYTLSFENNFLSPKDGTVSHRQIISRRRRNEKRAENFPIMSPLPGARSLEHGWSLDSPEPQPEPGPEHVPLGQGKPSTVD